MHFHGLCVFTYVCFAIKLTSGGGCGVGAAVSILVAVAGRGGRGPLEGMYEQASLLSSHLFLLLYSL